MQRTNKYNRFRRAVLSSATWGLSASLIGVVMGLVIGAYAIDLIEFPMLIILGISILVMWVMPDTETAPVRLGWGLCIAFITTYTIWPVYVSVQFPGLPWISVTEFNLIAMLTTWTYCMFTSAELRGHISRTLLNERIPFYFLIGWVVADFTSIAFSSNPSFSMTKAVKHQMYWSAMFFVAISFLRSEKQISRFIYLIPCLAFAEFLLALVESYRQQIVWLAILPPGFGANSEYIQNILSAKTRLGEYRAQGSHTQPLTYSEFMVIGAAYATHLAAFGKSRIWKIIGWAMLATSIPAVDISGSRSGVVGLGIVAFGYPALVALRRWQRDDEGLLGPALVFSTPVVLISFFSAVMASHRLYAMIFGSQQTQASTDARAEQFAMGIPKFLSHPIFGRGSGMGGDILGFTIPNGSTTIDTYVLSLLLETGAVGFLSVLGLCLWTVMKGASLFVWGRSPTSAYAASVVVATMAFMSIKIVLSLVDNNALLYFGFGTMVALSMLESAYRKAQDRNSDNTTANDKLNN